MSVSITGDGPNIALTGSGSSFTITVTTGSGGGGGGGGTTMPSGTAGQVPQLDTDGESYVVRTPNTANGLVRLDGSATIPDILHPSSIARNSEVTAAVAAVAPLTVAFMHFTNINLASPHPFAEFLTPGTVIELVGQWDPEENGTYTVPSDPTTNPLEPAVALLTAGNFGRQVAVALVAQGSYIYGPLEFVVTSGEDGLAFVPQSGTTLFAQRRVGHEVDEAPEDVVVDFDGALSAGALVLVAEDGSLLSYNLFQFVADGETMLRSRIQCGSGSTVRVMADSTFWTLTPHSGWVSSPLFTGTVSGDDVAIPTEKLTGLFFGISPDASTVAQQTEGITDVHRWISAYSDANVDLSLYNDPENPPESQPTLSDGTVPLPNTDVALIGQTTPGDIVLHHVEADGHWTPIEFPDVLYGNGFHFHLSAPGNPANGLDIEWTDDDPGVRQRRSFPWPGSSFGSSDASGGTWHKKYPQSYIDAAITAAVAAAGGGGSSHTRVTGPTITNSSTLSTLLPSTVDLGSVAVGDLIRGGAVLSWINNSGASKNHQLALGLNGTTTTTTTGAAFNTNANARAAAIEFEIVIVALSGSNNVSASIRGNYAANVQLTAPTSVLSTVDLTSGLVLDLLGATQDSTATQTLTMQHFWVEHIPT